jgi:hypothetical protein
VAKREGIIFLSRCDKLNVIFCTEICTQDLKAMVAKAIRDSIERG